MKSVRWGILGCGDVTEVKSGPAFQKIDDSTLVAVMRRDAEKAEDYAQRHNVPKWYENAEKLIHDPDVNAVYIATPPSSHAEYTIKALEAGKPVYVEKPMATTYAACIKMIAASEKTSMPLFVAYYRRCQPDFLKVRELIETKAIGEIRFVSIELYLSDNEAGLEPEDLPWRVIPEIAGGGHFFDLASHQLDFLDYLFGPIHSIRGHAANQAGLYPAEDIVSASFAFKSGVIGNGLWSFTVPEFLETDRIRIIGSQGGIVLSTFGSASIELKTTTGVQQFHQTLPEHIQQPLIQTVVDDLLGRGHCPSTGESAARTNWAMDEIVNTLGSESNQGRVN